MKRYRKKPVVVEARQLPTKEQMLETPDVGSIAMVEITSWTEATHLGYKPEGITIDTLEGTMLASWGDWIIKGVKGEFYPCKPDIFAETYEEYEEPTYKMRILSEEVAND